MDADVMTGKLIHTDSSILTLSQMQDWRLSFKIRISACTITEDCFSLKETKHAQHHFKTKLSLVLRWPFRYITLLIIIISHWELYNGSVIQLQSIIGKEKKQDQCQCGILVKTLNYWTTGRDVKSRRWQTATDGPLS